MRLRLTGPGAAAALCLIFAIPARAQSADGVVSDDVGAAEVARVRMAVERAPRFSGLMRDSRSAFVGVERERVKIAAARAAEPREEIRLRAVYYRYDDNAAVYATVDERASRVLATEILPNAAVGFGPEEIERAREIASADARLRAALGGDAGAYEIELLPIYAASREDALFGRRAASLLFKRDGRYRADIRAIVDLTAESLSVETVDPAAGRH